MTENVTKNHQRSWNPTNQTWRKIVKIRSSKITKSLSKNITTFNDIWRYLVIFDDIWRFFVTKPHVLSWSIHEEFWLRWTANNGRIRAGLKNCDVGVRWAVMHLEWTWETWSLFQLNQLHHHTPSHKHRASCFVFSSEKLEVALQTCMCSWPYNHCSNLWIWWTNCHVISEVLLQTIESTHHSLPNNLLSW